MSGLSSQSVVPYKHYKNLPMVLKASKRGHNNYCCYWHSFGQQIAKETADKFAQLPPQGHIPLGKHMLAMAIKAIAMTGMGRLFNDDKEVYKLATAYEEVRSFGLYA